MKILLSWIAYNNDFENGVVTDKGPTASYHQYFFKQDKHIILTASKEDDVRSEIMLNYLKNKYPERLVEIKYMDVSDPINHQEIQAKINPLLASLKEETIDVFISPGTPAMQVVWYLSHMSMNLNTTLYQTRGAQFTKTKERPELIKIDLASSSLAVTALYHQENLKRNSTNDNYKITPAIKQVYENAEKVAQTDEVSVLILGDSGTGKENLANFIHRNSIRKDKPYITVNCSAFSDQLLESRLFGYKKGAYTGAEKDSIGLFEEANEGTIFLDEIGDISPYMQQSLLRVLQEGEIMPIGGKSRKINVRVIAATNQHLVTLCKEGKFRWDLYYRLSVVELDIPTLFQRGKEDIKVMIDFFITQKKKQLKKPNKLIIDKSAMDVLLNYTYPGNIRELENIISRLYVFNDEKVGVEVLPKRLFQTPSNKPMNWDYIEKEHIISVLNHFNGNKRQTALAIGWAINTLNTKMEKYEIS